MTLGSYFGYHFHFRVLRKDHVGILRWHGPRSAEDAKIWQKMLNRGGNFKVKMSTKVCSNHFKAGYCSDVCPIPTLYLKGYDISSPTKRKAAVDRRQLVSPTPKIKRQVLRSGFDDENVEVNVMNTPSTMDHSYDEILNQTDGSARTNPSIQCENCLTKNSRIIELTNIIAYQEKKIQELQQKMKLGKTRFTINDISHSDKLVNIYTGLQNAKLFEWVYNRILVNARNLSYYGGTSIQKQRSSRKLDVKSTLLLVLVKVRLGLTDNDLAFRFDVSQSTVSAILNVWLPFLSREFEPFIHWPTREENERAYPKCFEKFPNTIGIIDCTEGAIEKPSLAKAQAQTYSTYKSKNTWKSLICITPSGTISYVSKTYGGCASDRFITETSGILNKIQPGDSIMADKGFNIGDLLVGQGSRLVIPPFLKDKGKFSKRNATKTSNIAKARIHVERAISRLKDFRILQGAIPLTRKDKLDDILTICAALTNLAPPLL